MRPLAKFALIATAAIVASMAIGPAVWWTSFSDYWRRGQPLANPIHVARVSNGHLQLSDGRDVVPAGVARRPDISPADYDAFLSIVVAQGIEIERDLGDGRVLLRAEPKFFNWCGTRGAFQRRWAGSYVQMPVSELLVLSGYADPQTDDPALSEPERARIEGSIALRQYDTRPRRFTDTGIKVDGDIIAIDGGIMTLEELIEMSRSQ